MNIYNEFDGGDDNFSKNEINVFPKTISKLIKENNLQFPFVVKKIVTNEFFNYLIIPVNTNVVIFKKTPTRFGIDAESYVGYIDNIEYEVSDSPTWMLVEKSGDNVLPLYAYRKFRENKRRKR